ncbi:T9SS type A sorting domain-containing protein [Paludibacter sp.]|uniref:T9SS type A sorting domain-containing protein n=1 Tax=Paludibacter sp. TaxID=1898105 RepID=UPI001354CDD5|nr:T9SS type A sorting domain-containing protein [Paludibacter sp.]MTK52684.1 T9SS type A sorting domain-containing protein [Paludibacter sp.]
MRFFVFIFLSLLFPLVLCAQEATSSAGGNISGKGGSVSYTLGQVSYTSISVSNITFGEGVQQAFDKISGIIPSDAPSSDLTIDCIVFPNPTTNYVTLTVKNANFKDLKYLLYDTGKNLIKQEDIQTASTVVSMVDLPTGTYLLTVMNPKKNILRIFKIIKDYIQQ